MSLPYKTLLHRTLGDTPAASPLGLDPAPRCNQGLGLLLPSAKPAAADAAAAAAVQGLREDMQACPSPTKGGTPFCFKKFKNSPTIYF